jgi:two-component system NtrC family sensor kinase
MRIVTSLKSKIIFAVSAILAVTIGLGTWINLGHQRVLMEEGLEDNVLIIASTIKRSLAKAMLEGKTKEVQQMLEAVGGYHNIRDVKIFSPNGVVLKSSNRGMIGGSVDPLTQQWFHADRFMKPIKRREEGIFSVLFPIENEPRCFRCHGSTKKLNGVLAVDISMEQMQAKVRKLSTTMFVWAVGITAILAVSLSLLLTYLVTDPIRTLIATMERAEDDIDVRLEVKSGDDIGQLGDAFNSLLSKFESAQRRVEHYHYKQMTRADRLASIGEMAAGIAHEIKNPLAGIAGVIQVLRKEHAGGDQNRVILDEVLVQVERMDKAVRNLLAFARPPEPKMTLADINELISRLLDFLAPQFARHSITVDRKLTKGLPRLTLDPDLMQQALINIALNAIQAMPEGGTFTVETRSIKPGGHDAGSIEIRCSDSGKGISQENLSRIFSPFFTTRQQGTGLGLSITQRIIEQHGGEINVASSPEKGTSFTLSFPYPESSKI